MVINVGNTNRNTFSKNLQNTNGNTSKKKYLKMLFKYKYSANIHLCVFLYKKIEKSGIKKKERYTYMGRRT